MVMVAAMVMGPTPPATGVAMWVVPTRWAIWARRLHPNHPVTSAVDIVVPVKTIKVE